MNLWSNHQSFKGIVLGILLERGVTGFLQKDVVDSLLNHLLPLNTGLSYPAGCCFLFHSMRSITDFAHPLAKWTIHQFLHHQGPNNSVYHQVFDLGFQPQIVSVVFWV